MIETKTVETLLEMADRVEQSINDEFNLLKETYKDEDIELVLEGPNVIFATKRIEFRVDALKWKPGKSHEQWDNFMGEVSVLFEGNDVKKLRKAIEVVFQCAKNNILFNKENECIYLRVMSS